MAMKRLDPEAQIDQWIAEDEEEWRKWLKMEKRLAERLEQLQELEKLDELAGTGSADRSDTMDEILERGLMKRQGFVTRMIERFFDRVKLRMLASSQTWKGINEKLRSVRPEQFENVGRPPISYRGVDVVQVAQKLSGGPSSLKYDMARVDKWKTGGPSTASRYADGTETMKSGEGGGATSLPLSKSPGGKIGFVYQSKKVDTSQLVYGNTILKHLRLAQKISTQMRKGVASVSNIMNTLRAKAKNPRKSGQEIVYGFLIRTASEYSNMMMAVDAAMAKWAQATVAAVSSKPVTANGDDVTQEN